MDLRLDRIYTELKDSGRRNFLEPGLFESFHPLNEMSNIASKLDQLPRNTKVYVYGENDEQGTKPPHFHVLIDNGALELEIYIRKIRDLIIWRTKGNRPLSWSDNNAVDVYKALKKWLSQKNRHLTDMTNIEAIVTIWNMNNENCQIDLEYTE